MVANGFIPCLIHIHAPCIACIGSGSIVVDCGWFADVNLLRSVKPQKDSKGGWVKRIFEPKLRAIANCGLVRPLDGIKDPEQFGLNQFGEIVTRTCQELVGISSIRPISYYIAQALLQSRLESQDAPVIQLQVLFECVSLKRVAAKSIHPS